jgi:surface carbohydrate biosynthesis protein
MGRILLWMMDGAYNAHNRIAILEYNFMTLLFPIEIGNREQSAKIFLACKFVEQGEQCYIGTKQQIARLVHSVPTPIYFDKGYHKGVSEQLFNRINKKNGLIVSLDEENGVDLKNNNSLNHRFPNNIFGTYDLIFLWGKFQYQFLKKNRESFNSRNVFAFGHPKFELLKYENRKVWNAEVLQIKKIYSDYILINSSFGLGNNILGKKFVISNYQDRIENIKNLIMYEEKQIAHFIELVKYLDLNMELNIVFRPHPEEDIDTYKNAFRNCTRVSVIYDRSIIPWIMGCERMIHHSCTTAIEAAMLDKNPISYGIDYNEQLIPWLPIKVSKVFNHKLELLEYISKEDVGENSNHRQYLDDYFAFYENTTKNIVRRTLEYLQDNKVRKESFSPLEFMIISNLRYFVREIMYRLKLKRKNPLLRNKIKGFNWQAVKAILKSYKHNDLVARGVQIKWINPELFLLTRKVGGK